MTNEKFIAEEEKPLPFNIPHWVNWIAQDESGAWWGYSVEPLRNDRGWYENEVGEYLYLGVTEPADWTGSLARAAKGMIVEPI